MDHVDLYINETAAATEPTLKSAYEQHVEKPFKMPAILAQFAARLPLISAEEVATQYEQVFGTEKPTLVLYSSPKCPYCVRVKNYLNRIDKTIPIKDVSKNPEARKELARIGGKKQIPCLVINGKALYESDKIIEWLKTHQDQY